MLRVCAYTLGLALLGLMTAVPSGAADARESLAQHPIRIMAVGDSITAGGEGFESYRPALAEALRQAGYDVAFVGTQSSPSPRGPLAHEGYGGKTIEYLAQIVPSHFRDHPADIVLLHSGHNHFADEQPIPGIIAATEALIRDFRAENGKVVVLLATVIPAGKLPKYSYIPDLNRELTALAARLDRPEQRVILVDQASGFDWKTDTIDDKVHPNRQGSEKMAATWFAALKSIIPKHSAVAH